MLPQTSTNTSAAKLSYQFLHLSTILCSICGHTACKMIPNFLECPDFQNIVSRDIFEGHQLAFGDVQEAQKTLTAKLGGDAIWVHANLYWWLLDNLNPGLDSVHRSLGQMLQINGSTYFRVHWTVCAVRFSDISEER